MGTMLGASFLLGAALGLLWGFLRPLGKRGDPLFVLMTGLGLCWLNFGVCGGDLRLGCAAAMLPGFWAADKSLGAVLQPVFYGFWSLLKAMAGVFLSVPKKIFKIAKNVFASAGKWVTIGRKNSLNREGNPMQESSVKIGSTRIVWNRSTPLLKVLILSLVVFSMLALAALSWVRLSVQSQIADTRTLAAQTAGQNRRLQERLADMESDEAIRAIASEELGLVDPDAVIIQPGSGN